MKTKKPRFPFWVLRLTNVELAVLGDALVLWLNDTHNVQATPEQVTAAERLLEAISTTIEKRVARRAKEHVDAERAATNVDPER